jgi:hypothetical protein
MGLQDGVSLKFSIGGLKDIDRDFRVYNWNRAPLSHGFSYTIHGYFDSPKFFIGTTNAPIRGSSSDALQKIAAECGIRWHPYNTQTSDSMLWMTPNSTYAKFAQQIARYGYVGSSSYMGLAIDSRGVMRYRDINTVLSPSVKVAYEVSDEKTIMIKDFRASVVSGSNNVIAGYNHERIVQSATTDQVVESVDKVSIRVPTPDPANNSAGALFSKEVSELSARGGVSYSPIDFKNVHPNYEQARYQNIRIARLNNLMCEFLFAFPTDFEPFETLAFVSPPDWQDKSYDGAYIVTGKVIFIAGSSYNEKVLAVRMNLL